MLLPPQFKDEALKTLGPPIRKEEEKKPVEVEVRPGIYRVNGKLETRILENEEADYVHVPARGYVHVSEIDIPLPEFKPIWRKSVPPRSGMPMRVSGEPCGWNVCDEHIRRWHNNDLWEWLDEGR